jgi:Nucleotidyl transferase AbiEii toxin, Type IV TA system
VHLSSSDHQLPKFEQRLAGKHAMNQSDAERWKSDVLDQIFQALAASVPLEQALVFKGARVLNLRLGGGRQSLDLDSNLAPRFVETHPDREDQRALLEQEMAATIHKHFEAQNPVRFELAKLQVKTYPPNRHPMGWDAFKVRINVNDLTKRLRNLPALDIDVAAPEELLDTSVSPIEIGSHCIVAYTLERIAGEKLRAFLSSLPAYRKKLKKPGDAVRAKDLHDLARIRRARDLVDGTFWRLAGKEFRLACKARYVDCAGLETFQEQMGCDAKNLHGIDESCRGCLRRSRNDTHRNRRAFCQPRPDPIPLSTAKYVTTMASLGRRGFRIHGPRYRRLHPGGNTVVSSREASSIPAKV